MSDLILGILAWTLVLVYVTITMIKNHRREVARVNESVRFLRTLRFEEGHFTQEENREPIDWQRNGF
jgi:hypothetical protein